MNSRLFSSSDIQSIVKKAVVERLKQKYRIEWFEEKGNEYPIRVNLMKNEAVITGTDRMREPRLFPNRLPLRL